MKKNSFVFYIMCSFGILIWVFILVALFRFSLTLPDVEFSASSGKCVKVIEYTDKKEGFSCNKLPEKYNKIWVK